MVHQEVLSAGADKMVEHSGAYDKRIQEYEKDNPFSPAIFLSEQKRWKEHVNEVRADIKELKEEVKISMKQISDKLASLPCERHEGDRKVLETRIKAIEDKPQDDKRIVWIAMLGCGVIGGLIVSGTLKVIQAASLMLGAH